MIVLVLSDVRHDTRTGKPATVSQRLVNQRYNPVNTAAWRAFKLRLWRGARGDQRVIPAKFQLRFCFPCQGGSFFACQIIQGMFFPTPEKSKSAGISETSINASDPSVRRG